MKRKKGMKLPKNEKIQAFLFDLKVIDIEMFEIVVEVREIILSTYPNSEEKMMYGGIVFFLNDEMYSGLFARKNHVSLEFSIGYLMKDNDNHLEGKGKYRRHLKIRQSEDILNKRVADFVKQAVSLSSL